MVNAVHNAEHGQSFRAMEPKWQNDLGVGEIVEPL